MKSNDYVAEILRAAGTLRSGDPAGVSSIVQNALALAGLSAQQDTIATEDPAHDIRARRTVPPHLDGTTLHSPRTERLHKPLGEVVRTLQTGVQGLNLEGLPGLGKPVRTPEVPLPDGAQFLDRHHACAAGARRYRLYVPATAGEGLQGLVVMLHGCTQNPEDFAAGTRMNTFAEEHRLLVVYPAQSGGDNAMSCWNWFRPGDQMRDAGEPAIIAGLTRSLRDEYDIPVNRVFVAGMSAGGAMAAVMGETYPELYEAVGVHSGLAYGCANDAMSALSAMRGQPGIQPARSTGGPDRGPRTIVFHGSADATVHPSNAERITNSKGGRAGQSFRTDADGSGGRRGYTRRVAKRDDGTHGLECWIIDGGQHAWSGGHPSGSYTDPRGPDASAAMVRFFLDGASDVGRV